VTFCPITNGPDCDSSFVVRCSCSALRKLLRVPFWCSGYVFSLSGLKKAMMNSVRPIKAHVSMPISTLYRSWRYLTVGCQIAHRVRPVLLLLTLPIIRTQLTRKASEHSVRLRQDLATELDDWDRGVGVQLLDRRLFVLGVFVEAVADVFVGYAGVLEVWVMWSDAMDCARNECIDEGQAYLP